MNRYFQKLGQTILLAMAVCWTPTIAGAQAVAEKTGQDQEVTVAQVVDRYYQAMGGKEKLAAVKTITTSGKVRIPEAGIEGTMEMIQQAPNVMKMKLSIPQIGDQQSGFDGKNAWEISDMMGARLMEGTELEQTKIQATIWTLWDHEKSFDSVEVTGRKKFADQDCHELTAKKEGLNPIMFYFSVDTGLHAGMRGTFETQMGDMEIEAHVMDYREVEGLKISHKGLVKLPNGISQVMEAVEIKINPELAADALAPPKEIKELIDAKDKDAKDK